MSGIPFGKGYFRMRMNVFAGKWSLLAILILSMPALTVSSVRALTLHGFAEGAYGARFNEDVTKKDDYNLLEGRLQIRGSYLPESAGNLQPEFIFKGDILYDRYDETTRGLLREAYLSFTPHDIIDVKAGRQILTWGTGDFVFINDLFPKDYVSFFIGRDDEYLKLPSDALKTSLFFDRFNLDVVLIPYFEPNNSLTGERVSFFNGEEIAGQGGSGTFIEPSRTIENMEEAIRIYRTVGSMEIAFYLFNGFYKEPVGVKNPSSAELFYPDLTVYGASARGPFGGGIGNVEIGYYESRDDRSGEDPLVENSGIKYLAGYSRDLGGDFKIGAQYQLEQILDYGGYLAGLSAGAPAADEFRHLVTLRLTKMAMNQNLTLSLFAFYSPSDEDYHARPSVSYKFTDRLGITAGGNIFGGKEDYTFFGQLRRNDNIYLRARYAF